jgi:DNA-binding winged helix-turn-helix (wHTH) protein
MKKHLEHYGYFTGRNLTIKRFGFEPKKGYKSNNDSDISDSETEENNSDTNNNNNNNNNDANAKGPLKNRINEQFKWV